MPVDVSAHPQFGTKMAKYNADRAEATQAGDELRLAQVNASWQQELTGMTADLYERQDQERGRQAELARIKAENPAVPASVFESIPDLAQAERVAKDLQATYSTAHPEPSQGSWSQPPAGAGGGDPRPADFVDPNEQRDWYTGTLPSQQKKMDGLMAEVFTKGAMARPAAEELMHTALEPLRSGAHRQRRYPPK